jgi:chaperonin cofactor prefoldin
MADEPENLILVLLREMRQHMDNRFDGVEARLGNVEASQSALGKRFDAVKQAAFADSLLGRYAVAEVEERLEDLTRRLEALEGRS